MSITGTLPSFDIPIIQALTQDWDSCVAELIPFICAVHIQAKPIKRLPAVKHWDDALKTAWNSALVVASRFIGPRLLEWNLARDAVALTEALLAYLALPCHVILHAARLRKAAGCYKVKLPPKLDGCVRNDITLDFGEETLSVALPPVPSNVRFSSTDPLEQKAFKAAQLFRKDRSKKAVATLTSLGVAPATPKTVEVLKALHPNYEDAIGAPAPSPIPQFQPQAADAKDMLLKRARDNQSSGDVFAWGGDMLRGLRDRGAGINENEKALNIFALLLTTLAGADLPMAVRVLLTTGAITALNKIPVKENRARMEQGLDPLIRPTNNGLEIVKNVGRLLMNSPAAVRVKKEIGQLNLGLGVSGGPAMVAWRAKALREAGFLIGKDDIRNGFNAMRRKSMLKAASVMWPEAGAVIKNLYEYPSLCLYFFVDDNGDSCLQVILGREGARMGCVLGAMVYDVTSHVFLVQPLNKAFPHIPLTALTDDLIPGFPAPGANTPFVTWDQAYEHVVAFRATHDALANPHGLFRHPGKSSLLVPESAPDPPRDCPLTIVRDGVIVAGAAIGTDAFITKHMAKKVDLAIDKVRAVDRLGEHEPQMGWKVVGSMSYSLLGYDSGVSPLKPCIGEYARFDVEIKAAKTRILTGDRELPACSVTRVDRAHAQTELAFKHGGSSHTPLTVRAPVSLVNVLLKTALDPVLAEHRHRLKGIAVDAYQAVLSLAGEESVTPGSRLAKVLPLNPDDMMQGDFARTLFSKNPKCRPQSHLLNVISKRKMMLFREQLVSNHGENHTHTSDIIRGLQITSRSQMSRLFVCSLYPDHNRIHGDIFRRWLLLFLGLPQPTRLGEAFIPQGCDAEVTNCKVTHGQVKVQLDPHGDHVASCTSAMQARYSLHDGIKKTVAEAGMEAGYVAVVEPSTEKVLGITTEEAVAMFPDKNCATSRARTAIMADLTESIAVLRGQDRERAKQALLNEACASKNFKKPIRLDLMLSDTREVILVDVGATHESTRSVTPKQLKFLMEEETKGISPSEVHKPSTPAVAARVALKLKKYDPILLKLQLNNTLRRDRRTPRLLACIMSHTGEMSTQFFNIIDRLTRKRRASAAAMGLFSPKQVAAEFQSALKARLACDMARGLGLMLRAGGMPVSGARWGNAY
jgi:hypothetical protein